MGKYIGKICKLHPELNGERFESNNKCVRCCYDRSNRFRATEDQRKRMREYQRTKECKGGDYYESKLERNKRWHGQNREWFRERGAARRKLGGSFLQFNNELRLIYKNRPEGHHVDHIIPLKGIDKVTGQHVVCGLHVPWNLQYMPSSDNITKWAWV